jgi:hypothetical protein
VADEQDFTKPIKPGGEWAPGKPWYTYPGPIELPPFNMNPPNQGDRPAIVIGDLGDENEDWLRTMAREREAQTTGSTTVGDPANPIEVCPSQAHSSDDPA